MRKWRRRILCLSVLLTGAAVTTWQMAPEGVPLHTMSDLLNHVRNTGEYQLALAEGQLPPTHAPLLNGATRVPLFQHYGGTAYTVPGLLALAGLPPYRALGVAIFLHVLAGGLFTYLAARALGARPSAALLAATALQTFPYLGPDLYVRGGYSQVLAFYAFPLVLYPMVRLVAAPRDDDVDAGAGDVAPTVADADRDARRTRSAWRWGCLAALAWAYFIPIHPIQTVMLAALSLGILGGHALLDRRRRGGWAAAWRGPAALAATLAGGAAASAWYWFPVARNKAELPVSAHAGFFDAGLADPWVLLSPFFRKADHVDWAPQLGLPFALGAVLALALARRTRVAGVLAALALVAMVVVILYLPAFPPVQRLLAPLQWSYRMMIPAGVAGALCLALGVEALCVASRSQLVEGAVTGAGIAYALTLAPWYFVADVRLPRYPEWAVLNPDFVEANANQYALRGTDLRSLNWIDGGGMLRTGVDLRVPPDGRPLDMRLVLRPLDEVAAGGTVTANLSGGMVIPPTAYTGSGDLVTLAFRLTPSVGLREGDMTIRFDASPETARWRVEDLAAHVEGDPPGAYFRIPPNLQVTQERRRVVLTAELPPGADGLYQLPVCYLPTNRIRVNGARTTHQSVDRFMTIVQLRAGYNWVQVQTRPHGPATVISGAAAVALIVGCLLPPPWGRRRKPQRGPASMAPVTEPGRDTGNTRESCASASSVVD